MKKGASGVTRSRIFSAAACMLIQQGNETSTKESTDSSSYRTLVTDPFFHELAKLDA